MKTLYLIVRLAKSLMLALVLVVLGCSSGRYSAQDFYFPRFHSSETSWKARARVLVYSGRGKQFYEISDRPYEIVIIDNAGHSLYKEIGTLYSGPVRVTADWERFGKLSITLLSRNGKLLLRRNLDFDDEKGHYSIAKASDEESMNTRANQ